MKTKLNIAYSLLTDLDILKNEKVLGIDEISELESRNLSHRLINNSLGKLYLQYYYAPMIVTAFKYFKDKYCIVL